VLQVLEEGLRYAAGCGRIALGTNGTYILSETGTVRAEQTLQSFQTGK